GLWAQIRLEEIGGGLRVPGDSVTLYCRGHGLDRFGTVWWYRQTGGGHLQWVSVITSDSSVIRFGKSVKGRASASRDNSKTLTSLSLRALHPQDSACYFCAVAQR
ncbi:HV03 protein, partial [Psilopogon haemacephalus]|nr:HV03 protein [Psilopogon haemacephalus]